MRFSNEWTTFQGKKVTLDTIDHQHLSNVYWFHLIVVRIPKEELSQIEDLLSSRFNGQLLPYRPHTKFLYELMKLSGMGCLKYIDTLKTEIWYQGFLVGEYFTTF